MSDVLGHDRGTLSAPPGPLRRRLVAAAVGLGLLATALVATSSPAVAASCGASFNTFTWNGEGDGVYWDDPNNWQEDCVPGNFYEYFNAQQNWDESQARRDDHVTIPAGANVVLRNERPDGNWLGWVYLAQLTNNGTLTVTIGSHLFVSEASTSYRLILSGSTLGGIGTMTVSGAGSRLTTRGAANQTTRFCDREDPIEADFQSGPKDHCSSPNTDTLGHTVIASDAEWVVDGSTAISDQRVIDNQGTVRLTGAQGYIAADDGTSLLNTGLFDITNDRGYYQGHLAKATDLGAGWVGTPQSSFDNTGTVQKSAGIGVSVIAADYSASTTSHVIVRAGTLSIQTPNGTTTRRADVAGGARLGNGACASGTASTCADIKPSPVDQQITTVQMTTAATSPVTVTLKEGVPPSSYAGVGTGTPVQIETPNAPATAAKPMLYRIYLDSSTLDGRTAHDVATTAPVHRKPNGKAWYPLKSCRKTPLGPDVDACIRRDLSASETDKRTDGDAVLVVAATENSRYRVG